MLPVLESRFLLIEAVLDVGNDGVEGIGCLNFMKIYFVFRKGATDLFPRSIRPSVLTSFFKGPVI